MAFHNLGAFICACLCAYQAGIIILLLWKPQHTYWYIKLGIVACLEWISSVILYRLAFHPLSKYPGPLIAAITDWYTVYWIANGGRHLDLHRRHQQYGRYVRFGPNRLSINSPSSLRDLHHVNSNTYKADAYGSFKLFFGAEMSLTTTDHKAHAFRRRVNAKAITQTAIAEFGSLVIPHVNIFLGIVGEGAGFVSDGESGWSAPKDMSNAVAFCLADIMGSITFGRTWNVQRETQYRRFVKDLPKGVAGIHLLGHMQSLFLGNLHQILFKELVQGVKQLMEASRSFALWRMEQTDMPHRDIWAALLACRDPQTGLGFTKEELISEASLFIIGGTDGMITATTATLFYLLHNQRTLERLSSELRRAFPLPPDSRGQRPFDVICPIEFASKSLQKITYLSACIDEAMRISPPVPSILPRVVGPGGMVVDGEFFPAGVNLGIPHYSLHRNEEYYPHPQIYAPERWLFTESIKYDLGIDLTPASQELEALQPGVGQGPAFTPFGAGRSSCIGKYLAYQEISIVLARLLWTFDMRLHPGSTLGEGKGEESYGRNRTDEFQLYDCFVSSQKGPKIQFRYRQELCS